ncbi:outer membrane protein [Pseudodonghicola sp.]|uniref:outer membrane protein n=1 Tax=Pseudodonghicola sp. TaxID=1969463 RepID=UPI003A971446
MSLDDVCPVRMAQRLRADEGAKRHDPLTLGARAMKSTLDLTFSPGALAGRQQHISDSWIDPLIAARISTQLNDHWSVTAAFDYGGFGIGSASKETWQAIATLGYAVNEDWTVMGGYRHLFVDRQNQGTDYSLEMTGLIFGATYRF